MPAPSQASTAASRSPERSPSIISSEAPKRTKSVSESTWRSGVHIPNDRIRASMFARIAEGSIDVTGTANRRASGQSSITGSPTSTTRPSRITTRARPIASITCSSPAGYVSSIFNTSARHIV